MKWDFATLDVWSLKCCLEAQGSAVLPTFLGSTLRGTFGHAFKAAACVLEPANCRQGCGSELCAYGYGFETAIPAHRSATGSHEDLPVPFVLIPPPLDSPVERRYTRGDQLEFTLRWFGRGTKLSEFVKGAVNDLGRYGLGAQRTPFTVTDMEESQVKTLADMVAERLPALSRPETIRLRFLTPARIRLGGKLQSSVNFELLVRNLGRRFILLNQAHGRNGSQPAWKDLQPAVARIETLDNRLVWNDLERYSNRQRTRMKLGGFLGDISFGGPMLDSFLPLLTAGEILHVGTSTAFGLGQLRILDR